MRISKRLTLSALVPVLVALVVCATLVFSYRNVTVVSEKGDAVRRVRNGITELNHLLFSYITYREERPKQQFLAEQESLTELIAGIQLRDPEQMGLVEELGLSCEVMKDLFLKLVSMFDISGPAGGELSREVEERLVGQLMTRSHRADSGASRLRSLVDDEIGKTYTRTITLIFLVLLLSTVPVTVVLVRTRRRITTSMARLHKGTEVVSSGNLEHIIHVERDDEIGELTDAFNRMTARLKEVTVSKLDLEREVTSRRAAEEELRQSEERLRIFIEHAPAALAMFDRQMRYVSVSRRWLSDYGLERRDLIGRSHYEVFPEIPDRWREVHRRGLSGEVVRTEEDRFQRADGSVQWLRWEVRPWQDAAGQVAGIVIFTEDITEIKAAEEELRKSRDELEQRVQERTAELELKNQELQNFTFVASHDLQEPLRKLLTFGDLITTRCADSIGEEGRDYLRRMGETTERMKALLYSLLEYSRLTSKNQPFTRVKLKGVVEAVLSDLEVQVKEAKASVEIGDLPEMEADAAQIASLFQNLIGNAIKFRRDEEPPRIRIHCTAESGSGSRTGQWEILVEDNGIGFDEEYLDLIFRPFQRLHGRKKYAGVGMGLAICKKVVERHGGSITARSTPGQGATFIVRLPRKR